MTTNNTDWLKLIKVCRVSHNRQVKEHFKDIQSDTSETTGRSFLKSLLLIDKNDSAIHAILKINFFQFYIRKLEGIEAIATSPDIDQVKVGSDRPQLKIVFKPKSNKSKTGYSELKIPHYTGSKSPTITGYKRGNFWARFDYKDGSKIWVYGATATLAEKMAKKLDKYVDAKYKPGKLTTGKLSTPIHQEIDVIPVRADFYSKGNKKPITWRHYF